MNNAINPIRSRLGTFPTCQSAVVKTGERRITAESEGRASVKEEKRDREKAREGNRESEEASDKQASKPSTPDDFLNTNPGSSPPPGPADFIYNSISCRRRSIELRFTFQVDFQLCVYSSPAIDLHYFLSTSTSDDVYDNHMESLLLEYIDTLTKLMKQLDCKTQPPTLEEIKKYMRDRAVYALIASISVLPIVTVDKSEAIDIDEMLVDNGEYNNPAYKGKEFRKLLSARLPKFAAMGLLDL